MITVERLSKAYGSKKAIKELTFTVPDATVTGFLGPNGSGKSTSMRCILGLDRPTSGRALFDGTRFPDIANKTAVAGALLDASWFTPERSGRGHLRALASGAGLPMRRVDDCLELVGLTEAAGKQVKGYSLGMKQRLGIASALLGNPRHLILDEPVNGLDPEGVSWMRQTIRRLADDGCAVLVSSHLLSEMQQTADRLVVIGQGEMIGEYGMDEFLSGGASIVVVSENNAAIAQKLHSMGVEVSGNAELLRAAVPTETEESELRRVIAHTCLRENIAVTHLSTETQNLEQRFLAATAASQEYRSAQTTPVHEGAL